MNRIARFEKVSLEQFKKDMIDCFGDKYNINAGNNKKMYEYIYDSISLPERKTSGSAGYDFHSPICFTLNPNETIKIPTGIRVFIDDGWVLKMYPRSSLGFKFRAQFDNTVGIIDSDYVYSDNEGHIFAKITNDSKTDKIIDVKNGEGFCQGIFVEYGITYDDNADGVRNGGIGSTNVQSK